MAKQQQKPRVQPQKKVSAQPAAAKPSAAIPLNDPLKGKEFFVLLGMLALILVIVFRDFLSGDKVFLFKDIGSDSINGVLPNLSESVNQIIKYGYPTWSFNVGMGQNFFPLNAGDPLRYFFALSGKDQIPFLLAFGEVFKIFFTGLFFYGFLRLRNLGNFASLVATLCFTFSGFIILGSGWYIFTYEALCASLLLYGFELFYTRGNYWVLPLPVAMMAAFQPFYLYLYTFLLTLYIFIRLADDDRLSVKPIFQTLFTVAGLYIVGLLVASVFLLPNVLQILQSPRVEGESAFFKTLSTQPLFGLGLASQYSSEVFRMFSTDLLGTGNAFSGWMNYLEAPVFYCGLPVLLLFPQIFSGLSKPQRLVYGIVTGIFLLILIFPWFRYAFWLFSGDYFRSLGLIVAFWMVFFSFIVLSRVEKGGKLNNTVLIFTLVFMLGLLFIPFQNKTYRMDTGLRLEIALFLFLYAGLFYFYNTSKNRFYIKAALLFLMLIELSSFSSTTLNKRDHVTSGEIKNGTGFFDASREALDYVRKDGKEFYRINKDYFSGWAMHASINDSQVQDFKGTPCYSSFNQKYYIEFLAALGIIKKADENQTRWASGIDQRPLLQSFSSIKYTLSKQKQNYLLGMADSVAMFRDVKVYKRKFAVNFGSVYNRFITPDDFAKLPNLQKDKALLKAVVLDKAEAASVSGLSQYTFSDTVPGYTFPDYEKDVNERNSVCFVMEKFDHPALSGSAELKTPGLMLFTIPYDKGWKAKVDGKDTELKLASIGFIGLPLQPGKHDITLFYEIPLFSQGKMLSILGILLLAGTIFLTFFFRKRMAQEGRSGQE